MVADLVGVQVEDFLPRYRNVCFVVEAYCISIDHCWSQRVTIPWRFGFGKILN